MLLADRCWLMQLVLLLLLLLLPLLLLLLLLLVLLPSVPWVYGCCCCCSLLVMVMVMVMVLACSHPPTHQPRCRCGLWPASLPAAQSRPSTLFYLFFYDGPMPCCHTPAYTPACTPGLCVVVLLGLWPAWLELARSHVPFSSQNNPLNHPLALDRPTAQP